MTHPDDVVRLDDAFARIAQPWRPMVLAELNGQQVKAARLHGAFDWHHHAEEDELFLVVRGRFRMEFRDRAVAVREGELLVVPRGVEHRPVADEPCDVLLFEPASTLNTGTERTARTVDVLDRY